MKILKKVASIISFIALLTSIVYYLNEVYTPKTDESFRWARAPYFEKKSTLDVVFLGSSHVEYGIDPNVIWKNFGIPSINYSVHGLDLKNTYFLLKELFKYHIPKVVVIDVYKIDNIEDAIGLTNRISNVFQFSMNRIEMINSNTKLDSYEKKMDYFFPLYLYHSRKLTEEDFNFEYKNVERGHYVNFNMINVGHVFNDCNESVVLNIESIEIVNRLIRLAKANGVKLLFIKTPNLKSDIKFLKQWNATFQIAADNKIPYLNFNKENLFKATGLDYSIDMSDDMVVNGHLNHFGAEKLSIYIGQYIKNKFHLDSKRGDSYYSFLDSSLKSYEALPIFIRNTLTSEQELIKGRPLISPNRKFKLELQEDQNLVLLKNNKIIWSLNTAGSKANRLKMQHDGNLVLYTDNFKTCWNSKTAGNPNSKLVLQDDGNLSIYKNDLESSWNSGTWIYK